MHELSYKLVSGMVENLRTSEMHVNYLKNAERFKKCPVWLRLCKLLPASQALFTAHRQRQVTVIPLQVHHECQWKIDYWEFLEG